MVQEDKELLLKDLSARLPYGVICQVDDGAAGLNDGKLIEVDTSNELVRFDYDGYWGAYIDEVKPYLRSMSSMTEEERKEYGKVCELDTEILTNHPMNGEPFPALYNSQDWLNAHHFDYRGLIEKNLALKAPKGMYNLK